uniref:Zinc transporter 9 n=1 Tax=Plectus sambesii TaxID=2011161 RepID=A0A914UKJ5_9BILA
MASGVRMQGAFFLICRRSSHAASLVGTPLALRQQYGRCVRSSIIFFRCNARRPFDGSSRFLSTEATSSEPEEKKAASSGKSEQPDASDASKGTASGSSSNTDKRLFSIARASKKKPSDNIPLAKPAEKIGKVRAMREYCLSEEQLKEVRCQMRRSPFLGEPPDIVFLISDVYERALEVHGSPEGLEKMRRKRNLSYSDRLRARLSDEVPQKFRSGQRMLEEKAGVGMKSSAVMAGRDPSMNVVLLEDVAAITGVGIALLCVSMSSYLQSPIPDAVGSILIGGLLGCVAVFIIRSNTTHLVGQSLPRGVIEDITSQLVNDPMIGSVHDVKATVLGTDKQRFKAEIDFNGRNITTKYLKDCNLDDMLKEVQAMDSPEALHSFMAHHGEKIVDQLGAEVDRIEQEIKEKHPNIRHVDLEAL